MAISPQHRSRYNSTGRIYAVDYPGLPSVYGGKHRDLIANRFVIGVGGNKILFGSDDLRQHKNHIAIKDLAIIP